MLPLRVSKLSMFTYSEGGRPLTGQIYLLLPANKFIYCIKIGSGGTTATDVLI
uniref:ORF52 n=1 Tax=Chlamydomonas reinhardtii TaxID=3055 RepID=Q32061_CHLRE|nr:ORF52; hypothetical; Method: conceptual translation supplied by author [Chlamydomonas reinhardtii]